MTSQPVASIPPLIRRNTLLLAVSQAFTGAGMQTAYAFGPLVVVALMGSTGLAGLTVSLLGVSRFLVAYPAGKVTDAYGRKAGMVLGLALAMLGTVVIGSAIMAGSFASFLAGLLVFGMGMSAAQQLRVAATDMYPPGRRAEGLGYVITGSMGGVMIAPALMYVAEKVSGRVGIDALSLPWLLMPPLILAGILAIRSVRPDPKEIGAHLDRYYPGYTPAPRVPAAPGEGMSAVTFFRHNARRVASIAGFAANGNMAIVMTTTSLVLHSHGTSLAAISLAMTMHTIGMFGFSLPMGRMTDRWGRRAVMLVGLLVATAGSLLVAFTPFFSLITLGAFLVGLGWCGVNVASTVLVVDSTHLSEQGQAVGLMDSVASGASILLPLIAGPLVMISGLASTGFLAMALMVGPILLVVGLREPKSGRAAPPPRAPEMAGYPGAGDY